MLFALVFIVASFISSVAAHVRLGTQIPGFGRIQNKYEVDNRGPVNGNNAPYGQEFCKGWHRGPGRDRAKPLKIGRNTFDLELDMAPHNGGSMQVSLSFDDAKSFKVLKSWIGNYPRNNGGNNIDNNQVYDFQIPEGTRGGYCIFSWSWSNEVGNREWYHDCAPVTIDGNGTSTLQDYPDIFVANADKMTGCRVDHGVSVEYPNPGKDVVRGSGRQVGPPKGDCGKKVETPTPSQSADDPKPAGGSAGKDGTYTVVAGDTCHEIGKKMGTTFEEMKKKNPSINDDCTNLEVGQEVIIRKRSRVMLYN